VTAFSDYAMSVIANIAQSNFWVHI